MSQQHQEYYLNFAPIHASHSIRKLLAFFSVAKIIGASKDPLFENYRIMLKSMDKPKVYQFSRIFNEREGLKPSMGLLSLNSNSIMPNFCGTKYLITNQAQKIQYSQL